MSTSNDQRSYALAKSGGACEVCGQRPLYGALKEAHRIGNTKANRAKYGSLVIDHILNIGITCRLRCSGALDISRNDGACIALCRKIYEREGLKYQTKRQ